MADILVVGASKGIGLETVRQALGAGHSVRALARSAGRITPDHPRLERIAASALNGAAMREALSGVDAAIMTLGIAPSLTRTLRPVSLFSDATRVLVPAMHEVGVKRLVCLTGLGAGDSRNRGNPFYNLAFNAALGRAYDDKTRQEKMVAESGLDWVIARPGILTDGPRTGDYRVLEAPADWRCGFIARADVADFLVGQVDSDEFLGKTPVLVSRNRGLPKLRVVLE